MTDSSLAVHSPSLRRSRDLEADLHASLADLRAISRRREQFYSPFDTRPARGGKWRHIDNPIAPLKQIQRRMLDTVLGGVVLPTGMLGGVRGRTVREAVLPHVGKCELVTMDVEACFDSVSERMVERALREELHPSEQILPVLVDLITFEDRLPQGAPTSTLLANLCLAPLYREVRHLCRRQGLEISIWVDDIAISGSHARRVVPRVVRLASKYGFRIRPDKTRVMPRTGRQEFLGIVSNDRPSSGRDKIRELRDEVLDLSTQERISNEVLLRVWGRIGAVALVNSHQGERLFRFAEQRIPAADSGGSHGASKSYRRCASKAAHGDS